VRLPCQRSTAMPESLTAADLLPLVRKLSHEEQLQLAKLTLLTAARSANEDVAAYAATPPAQGEFESDEDALGWDGAGWDEFDASR